MATNYTASVFITGSTSYPPIEYRLNNSTWQESNNFIIPSALATTDLIVEAVDELYRNGNLSSIASVNIKELSLQIIQPGATSNEDATVVTRWTTNIPAQSRIGWGVNPSNLSLTNWTSQFSLIHEIVFPLSFAGSFHYFKAYSRSQLGQYIETPTLGTYYVEGTISNVSLLEISAPVFTLLEPTSYVFTETDIVTSKVSINYVKVPLVFDPIQFSSSLHTSSFINSEISESLFTNTVIV
jgi:hypothetical protein